MANYSLLHNLSIFIFYSAYVKAKIGYFQDDIYTEIVMANTEKTQCQIKYQEQNYLAPLREIKCK